MIPDLHFRSLLSISEQASTGGLSPLVILLILALLILLVWFLLRAQTSEVEPLDHEHDDHHDHEEAAEAAAAEPAPVESAAADDLKVIEGIGPKVASVLNAGGIATYEQLAGASVEALREMLDAAGYRYMAPDSWPEQARLAQAGDWDALKTLQDELSAGRSS